MDGRKYGIEAEYALVRPDGRFAGFSDTGYASSARSLRRFPITGIGRCAMLATRRTPAHAMRERVQRTGRRSAA